MSLESRSDDGVPELTARVVRASFPKGTLAIRIREVLSTLFTDEDFAGAFPDRGRPAISPGALALVSVLQYAEGLSDRQAADQVRARMDWKFLLGLELDDPGFDFTVLGDFRSRLITHGLEERVLEVVLARLSDAGLLRAGGRQRTDSTHVLAAVRTLNRMEFVGETLRAALEVLAAAAPNWLTVDQPSVGGALRGQGRQLPFPERGERPPGMGRAGRAGRVRSPGRYRRHGGSRLAARGPRGPGHAPGLGRAVSPRRAGVRWREGKDLPPARDRLSSPYDMDVHYGIKRGSGWCGYKVHLSETCEPDAPHLITNVETTNATVNDTEVTATIHQHPARRELTPHEHVVDAGYVTAAHILAAREDHGIDLVGPVGIDTHHSGRDTQVPDLTQAGFTTNWDARKVICPHGAVSASWSQQRKASGTPIVRVRFALADCDPCPLRARCTKAANGKWGRSLTLLPRKQQQILEERRAEQQTDAWKERYAVRAGVEGTISQAVRRTHLRRTPYRGQSKTHLANILSATALNITRVDAWLNGTPLGSTRVSHLARLTLAA
ncbi:IS1182 family transposase [Streptomyces sp. NBC_00145]|uniref:IS1182 family transposase n=1 Tax=Streptomyces sp. NBC_00145 TaxID=2975666 RepID=UPI002E172DFF